MFDKSDQNPEKGNHDNPFAKYASYMVLIIVICVPWIITLQSENSDLKDELKTANETIAEMDEEIFLLQEQNSAWEVTVNELNMEIEKLDLQCNDSIYLLEELRSWTYDCVAICTPEDSTFHTFDLYSGATLIIMYSALKMLLLKVIDPAPVVGNSDEITRYHGHKNLS